ncbi:peptide N-acetyl-beta-D-glucosaminyl asparaginase amidase A-domain-containing protein [Cyathus striatus]|nr:peptide N-acetyl-beta-D-glucosaminyl asparaginase amidase A-domain-containing protein [Cyathus striatus]
MTMLSIIRPLAILLLASLTRAAVLIDFQVAQPPPVPKDAKQCTIQILQRDFAFSFGDAEVVQFTLGIFTFQNVEIWRTSTPEPTRGDAILHATFFASSPKHPPAKKSDLIIPLSTLRNDTGNDASVPPAFSNTVQIFAELYASGNGNEEFWYFNAANEFISSLPSGTAGGQGPFREVRLLVDGKVAGTAFPYATIFTGGIVPTAWRPITSYGALDLPTYFLDLTPFVPLLTDNAPHNFSIDVVSAEDDHTILQNWFVSGLLQIVTDASPLRTTGKMILYDATPFAQTSTTGSVERISDSIGTGAFYSQWNTNLVDTFSYPLNINLTILTQDGSSFEATFDHSYDRDLLPFPLTLRSNIQERQLAGGFFVTAPTGNTGNGTNNNIFSYSDSQGNTFNRQVNAALNNITLDQQGGTLASSTKLHESTPTKNDNLFGKARLPGDRSNGKQ